MSDNFEGGCLCGAVRFLATGSPKGVFWCHCQSCRRHSGAPVSVFVGFEVNAYTVTKGEIAKFKSSPDTTRGFCRSLRLHADLRDCPAADRDAFPRRHLR